MRLRIEPLELVELIRQTAEEHRVSADECALDVHLPETLTVEGDPTRLRQVIGNLVHNAIKFTDPGGRITIAARCDAERNVAVITVRDTGLGIAEESLARLFESFNQSENSLDRSRGGLGLGLALVKGLVELHGGTIAAHSSGLGKGSEFSVTLPLTDGDVQVSSGSPALWRPSSCRVFRILLVEDSQPVAEIFSMILWQMGHEVEVARNAAEALERIPVYRPQIVFSDISMPAMNGYELAQRIRQEPDWSDLVLVAVTGYGQPEDCTRARRAGFDHHLVKPADIGHLDLLFAAIANEVVPASAE